MTFHFSTLAKAFAQDAVRQDCILREMRRAAIERPDDERWHRQLGQTAAWAFADANGGRYRPTGMRARFCLHTVASNRSRCRGRCIGAHSSVFPHALMFKDREQRPIAIVGQPYSSATLETGSSAREARIRSRRTPPARPLCEHPLSRASASS